MDLFTVHKKVIDDYKDYISSFINIKDETIKKFVSKNIDSNTFWKEPLIQFNPSFKIGATIDQLTDKKLLDDEFKTIYKGYEFYEHQVDAINKGKNKESFVVTTGTGSGKSLTYLTNIFNSIIQGKYTSGIKAVIVYPMNALINSQYEEIRKYHINYLKEFVDKKTIDSLPDNPKEQLEILKSKATKQFPITYALYTGQQDMIERQDVETNNPHILLTNYMMLELIMTRGIEAKIREIILQNIEYLVFDELHTYRGRQGSDVSLLIRRIKNLAKNEITFIGTSATMSNAGTIDEQKREVAKVASQIFGKALMQENIITETLSTSTNYNNKLPTKNELISALKSKINIEDSEEAFKDNSIAIWLENKIALHHQEDGQIKRNPPITLKEVITLLSNETSVSSEICKSQIEIVLKCAENLNINAVKNNVRKSYLPFKFHQFITQTGYVYVTLDERDKRKIVLEPELYYKDDEGIERFYFPVLLSRVSGHEFICVRKDFNKMIFSPRDPDDIIPTSSNIEETLDDEVETTVKKKFNETDYPDGYLVVPYPDEDLWNEDVKRDLPYSWWKEKNGELEFEPKYKYRLPQKIYFDNKGNYSSEPKYNQWGYFIAAKLIFDLTSGAIYGSNTKEYTKLMRIGNEGRSTATTLLSFSTIKSLRETGEKSSDQKILSFTDNRQDASLQSGHFNDFITTGRIRSAIYHALKKADSNRLTIDNIAERVFNELKLPESEYAIYPTKDKEWGDPENELALKEYLTYRIILDLKRGWRYTMPNLEHAGLLQVDYVRLDEFIKKEELWKEVEIFNSLSSDERKCYVLQILNFFRSSYAFSYSKYQNSIKEIENRIKLRLDSEKNWSLDVDERMDTFNTLMLEKIGKLPRGVFYGSLGDTSAFGKFIKDIYKKEKGDIPNRKEFRQIAENLLKPFVRANFLEEKSYSDPKKSTYGYQLRLDSVIWKLGNEKTYIPDLIRLRTISEFQELNINKFFQDFYKQDFSSFEKGIEAKEHTGQVKSADREIREADFREGKLSALFCSPTMELGIDISSLNVVHMRNVPPSPSNYAQRSGRAGRSGQNALVFTYCSANSPHDRNYFKHAEDMIAGSVLPAKIDLLNEELIYTHLNAYVLMELKLTSLRSTVTEALDLRYPDLPIHAEIINQVNNHIKFYHKDIVASFNKIITDIHPKLKSADCYWFSDDWVSKNVNEFLDNFSHSFDRWRKLYNEVNITIANARRIKDDPTIKSDNPEKREASYTENKALKQRALLMNDSNQNNSQSEFYIYRYLAAEGFIPGYNFTRLPVRSFIGARDKGEYISRPRFTALKEFAPRNLIYYNGSKYRIDRMVVSDIKNNIHEIKISKTTGYVFLDDEGKAVNNDPITNKALKGEENFANPKNLVELLETETRPAERINCEEEDRTSTGYEIDTYFSFPAGIENTRKVKLLSGDREILNVIYAPSARLMGVNKRWRISKSSNGFAIGTLSGRWKKQKELTEPNPSDPAMEVMLYTSINSDILYILPTETLALDEDGVITLMYALKRAIENLFQAEPNEIGVYLMGEGVSRNILIQEASEGSLGIMSQIIDNTVLLKKVFEETYRIIHYDLKTKTDTKPDQPKASYDNLLSYYNQRYHEKIDRHSIAKAIELLISCDADNTKDFASYKDKYQHLCKTYDLNSSTEKPFIDYLCENGINLPDGAQKFVDQFYVQADFFYKPNVLVFCDGSVHDDPKIKEQDIQKRNNLRSTGHYDVIEWHYKEPIEKLIERRKDIFRKIK